MRSRLQLLATVGVTQFELRDTLTGAVISGLTLRDVLGLGDQAAGVRASVRFAPSAPRVNQDAGDEDGGT